MSRKEKIFINLSTGQLQRILASADMDIVIVDFDIPEDLGNGYVVNFEGHGDVYILPEVPVKVSPARVAAYFDELNSQRFAPCPFCGSSDIDVLERPDNLYIVGCQECNANMRITTTLYADLYAQWNKRSTDDD